MAEHSSAAHDSLASEHGGECRAASPVVEEGGPVLSLLGVEQGPVLSAARNAIVVSAGTMSPPSRPSFVVRKYVAIKQFPAS
jgi:hypothetical protein